MDIEKKTRVAFKLQALIIFHPDSSLPLSTVDSLSHLRLRPLAVGSFLLHHPHAFHIFDNPVLCQLWACLTPATLSQIRRESDAIKSNLVDSVLRLKKLLVLATPRRCLRHEHIQVARRDLVLPDDFKHSVILANPLTFRLIASATEDDPRAKFAEVVATKWTGVPSIWFDMLILD